MYHLLSLILLFTFLFNSHAQTSVALDAPAPEIKITEWIKNIPDNKSLEGKAIVLEFWATWCGGCIAAVPHLNQLKAQFDPKEVLFLSMTDESPEKIERVLKRINFETAVVCDQSKTTHMGYGENGEPLTAIPKTILIDKKGIVQWIGVPTLLDQSMIEKLIVGEKIPMKMEKKEETKVTISTVKKNVKKEVRIEEIPGANSNTLDIWEATEEYKVSKKFKGEMTYTNLNLKEIYEKIFNVGANQVDIPADLQDKKYSFTYISKGADQYNLEILEQKILDYLNLSKTEEGASEAGVNLTVVDKSKLESALETRFSTISDADDKMLIYGVRLKEFERHINAKMQSNYKFDSDLEGKYDFILNVKDQEALQESLKSYGISSSASSMEVKKIKLMYK